MADRIEIDKDKVTVIRNNVRITMTMKQFEERVASMTAHYDKSRKQQRDHLGGVAAEMYDPDLPMPQTFSHRVTERWLPSGAKSGPCTKRDMDYMDHYLRREKE